MCQLPLQRFARYSVELAAREEPELRRFLLLAPQEVYDYPDVQRVGREALGSRVEQPAYFAFGGCQVASGGGIRHAREGAVGQSLEGSAFGREFFIRKAIGWALREYSKTDAAAVVAFVAANEGTLSGLSRREALVWLDRRRRASSRS